MGKKTRRERENQMKNVCASGHLSTGVITISVIGKMYAYTYISQDMQYACDWTDADIVAAFSCLSIRRVWAMRIDKAKIEYLLIHWKVTYSSSRRAKATMLCVTQTNNIYMKRKETTREEKKWQLEDKETKIEKDVRAGSVYINCVYNLFDVSMNAMWINKIPWNKQAESYFLSPSLSKTHTHTPEFICFIS